VFFNQDTGYARVVVGWGLGESFALGLSIFGDGWSFILKWLGIFSVLPSDIGMHATQFGGAYLFRNDIRIYFQLIWLFFLVNFKTTHPSNFS